jgi:hypothetical protein
MLWQFTHTVPAEAPKPYEHHRLAVVERLDLGELLGMGLDQVGQP